MCILKNVLLLHIKFFIKIPDHNISFDILILYKIVILFCNISLLKKSTQRGSMVANWSRSLLRTLCGSNLGSAKKFQETFQSALKCFVIYAYVPTLTSTWRVRNTQGELFCTEVYGMGPYIGFCNDHFQSERWLIHIRYRKRGGLTPPSLPFLSE